MSAIDFEMVRLGLSQQDRDGWLAVQRIEKLQGELVAALERMLDPNASDRFRVARDALAKVREDAPDAEEQPASLTRPGGPRHCSQDIAPPRGSLSLSDPRPVEDMDE